MGNKSMHRILYRVLRKTGINRDKIKLNASFKEDLNFDQLDWTLFIYYLEDGFQIRLNNKEISELEKVSDTLCLLEDRVYVG